MKVALSVYLLAYILIGIVVEVKLVNQGNDFRCDYEYIEEIDGWMKFHAIPANWFDARLRCHLEGTTLASPLNPDIQEAMISISKHGAVYNDIFTGIHSTFSKGNFYSIEGVPISDLIYEWDTDEPDNFNDNESCISLTRSGTFRDVDCNIQKPYVCYKRNDENHEINECGTIDNAYMMNTKTGSCYKFHGTPRIYSRAFMTCAAEGGYLSIINSEVEARFIRNLFAQNPASSMIGPFYKDVAYLGFHDWNEHGEWLTINGETLENAGYDKWSPGEPNNLTGEYCGAAYRSGLLLDLTCDTVHAFICEKSPASLLCD